MVVFYKGVSLKSIGFIVLMILSLYFTAFSQTGPGGVGNKDGSAGQPQNSLWLRVNTGLSQSGGLVNSWTDQSGNLNNATGTGTSRPTYVASDASFNNFPAIELFNTAGINYHLLVPDADNLDNSDGMSFFVVIKPVSLAGTEGILSKRTSSSADQSYVLYRNTNTLTTRIVNGSDEAVSGTIFTAGSPYILSSVFSGSTVNPRINEFHNGVFAGSGNAQTSIPNNISNLFIGTFDNSSGEERNITGRFAEVIIYHGAVNAAQRQIIQNYLSSKYNIPLSAGNLYVGNTAPNGEYDFEVVGIGRTSATSHTDGNSAGFILSTFNGTLDADGEFLLAGHNNSANSVSVSNLGPGVQQRWAKDWFVDKTSAGVLDAAITFDFTEGISGLYPQNKDNYVLLRFNGTNYVNVGIANSAKVASGDRITFQVPSADLIDGRYTLGTIDATNSPVNGSANRIWYSYQTGNWSNSTTWTLDGSVTPLLVNPSNEIPSAIDQVVITSGRTVTMDINNVQTSSTQVIGYLDVVGTSGHNFTTIKGNGRILISGAAGVDNFPSGATAEFADPNVGGTVEIYGAGLNLNQNRIFNNVEVNLNASATIATLLADYTLNGNLTLTRGNLRINDNALTTAVNITVNKNVEVDSGGKISVGTGNARHQFNFYGDLTNQGGVVELTNRVAATYGSEATDGIVDANFLSSTIDQQIVCNGSTRFYRIKISKGTNDTYKLTLTASASVNFNLFGYADEDHGSVAQIATTANSLALLYGTLEIGTNILIPVLSTGGNYNVSEGAQLWINGGTVNKNSGNSLVPYGIVRVTSGTLTSIVNAGITIRDNGTIIVEGGTVTTNQIRTSVLGPTNVGGYVQSGGTVTVDGGGAGGSGLDYYVFSLTYAGNVFNMSGGDLIIKGARSGTGTTRGAIFIASDPANVAITGGRVIFEISNANNYKVTSRAPFWDVLMRRTAGAATVIELNGGDSGAAGAVTTLTIQPLVVLNDITIQSPINFTTNNADITLSGNLDIQNGAAYTHGTNTTTVTGVGVSSLIFSNTGTNPSQTFNNFVINKTNAANEVAITSGNVTTAMRVNGALTVSRGTFNHAAFIVSARGAITLGSGVSVGKLASTGKLLVDGTTAQTISSSSSFIYNLELNNSTTPATALTLTSGFLTIYRTLTLTDGVFNIATNKLTLSGASASISGSGFSNTKMIQTSGNTSDGGLELYVNANEAHTYPIGVSGKYTPVTATFTSYSDDGLINIIPVNSVLQTTNLGGGTSILGYYWRVNYSNFTTRPLVSYQFTYRTSDAAGTETTYVPGKVLDVSPFTRSIENDVNKVAEGGSGTGVITFNGTGTGFTLEQANYTAGATTRFTGTVRVLYTRKLTDAYSQAWTDGTLWTFGANASFGVHDSRQANANTSPGAGDIAVIGWVPHTDPAGNPGRPHGVSLANTQSVAEVRFTQMLNAGGTPTARVYYRNFQFRPTLCLNNNGGGNQGQLANGTKVSGEGMFWNRSTNADLSDPAFTGVDLGSFNDKDSSYVVYESTLANANYINTASTFPNLMMATDNWGADDANSTISTNITVNGDLELLGDVNLVLSTGATGDITVNKKLRFFRSNANGNDSGGGGEIRFGNTGTARTITVLGNLVLGNGFASLVSIPAPSATPITHTFNLHGNFIQNTTAGNGFKAGTSSTNDRIHVNFLGSTSMSLTNTGGGDAPQFYSLTVNKGSSILTTATFNTNFTINGPTNTVTKSLVLQNGLFIINNASAAVVLSSGGGDFNIPSTAGLEVRLGAVSMTTASTGLTLDGLLKVSGGNVTLDAGVGFNNFIEYSSSGNSTIDITAGTLTVGSQVRRSTSSTTGVLKYSQSAGTVVIANRVAPITSRGVFEVLNPGSQFTHTGGSLTLVQGIVSTTVPSLLLEPASSTITGSTITIGNANTPNTTNAQNIGIQSTVVLNNLTVNNTSGNNPIVKLYSLPLTLNGNLDLTTGTTFNAQGFALTLRSNMIANGTYVPSNNTTYFSAAGAAAISGSSTIGFYDFVKNAAGTLTLSSPITINRDMTVSTGIISQGVNTITLLRNAEIDATLTSTSGNGLIFQGTGSQLLTRSAAGTGTMGIVTVDNLNGITIPDGNGFDFLINTSLRLKQGVFDIGSSLLSLAATANIVEVNTFSATNMIQTNSSFTDNGVRKSFNAGVITDFTFPVGQLKYTPVIFNFSSAGNTTGSTPSSIIVRPANEKHPSIVEDIETPGPQIVDINNVLQYHWIINANTSTNFSSDMTLFYSQSDVAVQAPYTEVDYIAARILSDANPTAAINKFSTAEVNETNNTITIPFNGVSDAGISGEYFAGVDPAIPSNIPIFTTTRNGNVNEGGVGGVYDITVPGGGAPTGAILIVDAGDILTLNVNDVSLYSTEIRSGATLNVNGTIGHRLGIVTGTGTIRLTSNTTSAVLPAGFYNDFFTCTGGGIEYFGTGSYSIMNGISTVRSLLLDGSGSRNLSTNDIIICDNLTVNGPTLGNANNISITVQDDIIFTGGTINKGTTASVLNVNGDFNQTAGTFNGQTAGTTTIDGALILAGGTFDVGSVTSRVNLRGNVNRTSGTFIGGVGSSRVSFTGSSTQFLSGSFTGSNQFFNVEINNVGGLTVLSDVDVSNTLFLTTAMISTVGTNFTLLATAVVSPTIGKVNSNINGKLRKIMNTGTSFTFPISKAGYWRNASVNNTTGAVATWDAEYFNSPPTIEPQVDNFTPTNSSILTISRGEYWAISDGTVPASGKTAILGLMWGVQSDVSTVKAERESMQVMAWNDATSTWDNFGGGSWSASHTQSNGYFTATSTTSFSRRIVALGSTEVANPLPIDLNSFTGRTQDGVNTLNWITDSELNNERFEIERSADGEHFEFLATIPGNFTSNTRHKYSLDDIDPLIGKNYYRLKQIDLDGNYSYAKNLVLLTIEASDITLSFLLYPNPTETNNINLKIRKDNDLPVRLRIMDLNGREVITKMVDANFSDDVKLISNKELSAGVYLIELSQGHRREVKRLVIK